MIRGEQFYDFDKNDFTAEELEYIEARSQELVEEDPDFVAGYTSIEYDDARYMTVYTKYPGVESFGGAGTIRDEKAQSFEDSIELVSLRERVAAALGGASLYGMPEKTAPETEDSQEKLIFASKVAFMLSDEKFTSDEIDYVWACVQRKVDSMAPHTRLEVTQSDKYTFLKLAIESDLDNIDDSADNLKRMIVGSVRDKDLRKKFRDSLGGISSHSDGFREDEFGYGVSNFDEYLESRKTEK